jgi:serine/threonine protein phosphatase PrpC
VIVTLAASAVVAGLVICGIIAFAASENRGVQYVRGMERWTPPRGRLGAGGDETLPGGTAGARPAGAVATGEGGDAADETAQDEDAQDEDDPGENGPDESDADDAREVHGQGGDGPDEGHLNGDLNGDQNGDLNGGDGTAGAHDWSGLPLAPLVAPPRPALDDGVPRRSPDAVGRRTLRSRPGGDPRPVPLVKFDAAGRTNAGNQGDNADGYLIQEQLIAMADGITRATESRWASALALGAVVADQAGNSLDPLQALRDSLEFANATLRGKGEEAPELAGMATSLDVVLLAEIAGAWALVSAHVGSGSIFLFTSPDEGEMLTTPHSVGLDPIVRAVGAADQVTGDVESTAVRPGALVVLASNGLTGVLSFPEIQAVVGRYFHAAPQACAEVLLRLAYRHGPKDDVTVVVARVVRVTGYVWGS